jgi:hypothetical protein
LQVIFGIPSTGTFRSRVERIAWRCGTVREKFADKLR